MRNNINLGLLFFIMSISILTSVCYAQQKNGKVVKKTYAIKNNADSLFREFDNAIYNTYYNSSYWKKSTIPVFTVLKIDIDKKGSIKSIKFSDSADTLFVAEFLNKPSLPATKSTLEKYLKAKSYNDISILIPVSYEPLLPNSNKYYTNDYLESYLKFNKKNFTGKFIMLSPMYIKVNSRGEI